MWSSEPCGDSVCVWVDVGVGVWLLTLQGLGYSVGLVQRLVRWQQVAVEVGWS